jgi:glycerol 2-dehydrogenase (NADP+)
VYVSGLGTWQSEPGQVKAAVLSALKLGYKHIDAAYCYGNENEVGEAFEEAFSTGVCKREDIWVTTKLWCTYHSRAEHGLKKSLKALRLDYVDLFLVHWPVPMNPNGNDDRFPKHPDGSRDLDTKWSHTQTWEAMEALPKEKARNIGVCNYSVPFLTELLKNAKTTPAVNQIENHPLLPQQEIVDFCKDKGIHITAYSPLGSTGSPLFKEEEVLAVAKEHDVSVGSVLLSYHVARGSSVLAKSVNESRIKENMNIIDLSSKDMEKLEGIHEKDGIRRYVYPAFGVALGFPDKP